MVWLVKDDGGVRAEPNPLRDNPVLTASIKIAKFVGLTSGLTVWVNFKIKWLVNVSRVCLLLNSSKISSFGKKY